MRAMQFHVDEVGPIWEAGDSAIIFISSVKKTVSKRLVAVIVT
jgi:hypothetical protein